MSLKGQTPVKAVLHSGALTIVPTFKDVAPYSRTSLNVGTKVNAPLCNSIYLFLSFLWHPYILTVFVKKNIISSFCIFCNVLLAK